MFNIIWKNARSSSFEDSVVLLLLNFLAKRGKTQSESLPSATWLSWWFLIKWGFEMVYATGTHARNELLQCIINTRLRLKLLVLDGYWSVINLMAQANTDKMFKMDFLKALKGPCKNIPTLFTLGKRRHVKKIVYSSNISTWANTNKVFKI